MAECRHGYSTILYSRPTALSFAAGPARSRTRSSRPPRSASSPDWRGSFETTRQELLRRRVERQQEIVAGEMPDFLPETAAIREEDWKVAPIPADLRDRRVEITGPVDRKMVINALNSGANVFMADFEDSNAPTWRNNVEGQLNLRDAVRREISFASPEGKQYRLNDNDRDSVGAAARLASGREAHAGRRAAGLGVAFRFRPVLLPQRGGAARARDRAVFLSAEDGKPPRSAPVERRIHVQRSRSSASRTAPSARRC